MFNKVYLMYIEPASGRITNQELKLDKPLINEPVRQLRRTRRC